jgi:hypothetical protein
MGWCGVNYVDVISIIRLDENTKKFRKMRKRGNLHGIPKPMGEM